MVEAGQLSALTDSRAHKNAVLHAIFMYTGIDLYERRNCCVVLNILLQGLVMLFFSFFRTLVDRNVQVSQQR